MTDYFGFYGLPISFNPDAAAVKQQFYALSKKYHPDFYINESEEKQAEVLELSTLNNKAYQVLSDPQKRLHYILELKGLLTEGENYVLPQAFLMEMMDVNEALMDLQFDPDAVRLAALQDEVVLIEKGIADEILKLTASFDDLDETEQGESLVRIKDLYYRNKYLLRIRASINKATSSL
ncbi:MAG: Fe-S protein assembly co-chaperone HscB [Candidatus Pedobacter colombiensis]|uniref:Fe-S protein assembly co-chaperone HscB n=1 Tax=Candidatus Pedobacter colombiensis TaxID=3121371 RepID=A0AAJ6B5M1_9SPHI|nr:Fe-S protein assembly co-chaperone HscB [Pedobacter sp.]WEK18285.1 MAG: Fe-S protein assembly co-chaperone HscB [Pedobacter sp.]